MKRSWLIFKYTVFYAFGQLIVSLMGILHAKVTEWTNKGIAELGMSESEVGGVKGKGQP